MNAEEEQRLSSALDNPIVYEAVVEVISLHDVGFDAGFLDGRSGKPVRQHPGGIPELFRVSYLKGHELGGIARSNNKRDREIAKHLRFMGLCREDHVVQHEEVEQVEIPGQSQQTEGDPKNQGFWVTYGPVIATFIGASVGGAVLGFWTGKTREQKRCMDIRRDMGVDQ